MPFPSIFFLVLALSFSTASFAGECKYNTWEWNTLTRKSENHRIVSKPYNELSSDEKGTTPGCSVCLSDQSEIKISGLPTFIACKRFEAPLRFALQEIKRSGFKVFSIKAYRVGRSKGLIDKNGLRSEFSNHSYGTAIDINAERNGLYKNCESFGTQCQLLRGGSWNPKKPGTITENSSVVKVFRQIGWKWGGKIYGKQKDFMHFSITGY